MSRYNRKGILLGGYVHPEFLARIDALIESGLFFNRAEFIRSACVDKLVQVEETWYAQRRENIVTKVVPRPRPRVHGIGKDDELSNPSR